VTVGSAGLGAAAAGARLRQRRRHREPECTLASEGGALMRQEMLIS
jgi:hypothetical protein